MDLVCQHVSGCDRAAVEFIELEGGRLAGVCAEHGAAIARKEEELGLLLKTIEIKCPRCDAWAPEGLLLHDCDRPGPQPPAREIL